MDSLVAFESKTAKGDEKLLQAFSKLKSNLALAIKMRSKKVYDNFQLNSNQVYRFLKAIKAHMKEVNKSGGLDILHLLHRLIVNTYAIQSNIQGREKDRELRFKTMKYFVQDYYELRLYYHFTARYLHEVIEARFEPDLAKSDEWRKIVPSLVKILSEMDTPSVEELKICRLGKILNKIAKADFDDTTRETARSTMERWKQHFEILTNQ